MTGLLNDLMHDRADRLEPPELDLAGIVREGDERVRRRRTAVVGGAPRWPCVAAVVPGAPGVPAPAPGREHGPAPLTRPSPATTDWATGRRSTSAAARSTSATRSGPTS